MQPLRIQFTAVDAPETFLDRAIEWLLIALLAFCPFAFGAVEAWSEGIFLALVSGMAICLAIKLVRRPDARFVWSWTYLPIALFLILVALQLLPLPASVVALASPATALLKTRLLSDLPQSVDALRSFPMTFYSEATLRQLRLVAAMAAIFVIVINVFQRIESIRRLLLAISLIGLAQAILALAQDATQSTRMYWTITLYTERATSGSFVNHSHFGQFMNLSIGAAIGLLLLELHTRGKRSAELDGVKPFSNGARELAAVDLAADGLTWIRQTANIWIAGLTITACTFALLFSLTRGGMVSMLAAGAMSLTVLRFKAPARSKIVSGVSLLVVLIVLAAAWVGVKEVFDRLASVTEVSASHSRGEILRDLRSAWKQFPIFGTGLGTHSVIFPMFDRSNQSNLATHAENEYAQTMTETGALGLGLAMAFAVMIWMNYGQTLRGRFSSISAVAIGLGYGFAAILIHSISDFGQHIPSDAALTAVTCALLVSLARERRMRGGISQAPEEFRGNLTIRWFATAITVVVCAGSLFEAQSTWAAERQWKVARKLEDNLRKQNWPADNQAFAQLIAHAQRAADIRPGNVEYAYWLPVYRWKWLSVAGDPADATYAQFARKIVDELHRSRLRCLVFGQPASVAGQIELFVLHDPKGPEHIRLGSELNRNDPTAVFVDGQLAASQGDWAKSLERLKHFGDITGGQGEVVDLYLKDFHRPDLALQAVEGNAAALDYLAQCLTKSGGDAEIIATAKQQAEDLQLAAAERPTAELGELARAVSIAADRNDHQAAIRYARRALQMDYSLAGLRFQLAKSLVASGNKADAIKELDIVVHQNPGFADAEKMLDDLRK